MPIETFEYEAPSFLASYLVNGDASGLEDSEQAACDAWLATLPGQWCVNAEEIGFQSWHHAREFFPYATDCSLYTFHK